MAIFCKIYKTAINSHVTEHQETWTIANSHNVCRLLWLTVFVLFRYFNKLLLPWVFLYNPKICSPWIIFQILQKKKKTWNMIGKLKKREGTEGAFERRLRWWYIGVARLETDRFQASLAAPDLLGPFHPGQCHVRLEIHPRFCPNTAEPRVTIFHNASFKMYVSPAT